MIKYFYKKELAKIADFEKSLPNLLFKPNTVKSIKKDMIIIDCFKNVFGDKTQHKNISLIEVLEDINKIHDDLTLLLLKYDIKIHDLVKDKDDFEYFKEEMIIKYDIEYIFKLINDIHETLGFNKVNFNNEINLNLIIMGIVNKTKIPYNGSYLKDDITDYLIGVSLSEALQLEVINGYIKLNN